MKKKTVETERIVNISDLENLIRDARIYADTLKKALQEDCKETSIRIAEKLDLKLHEMEAFDFILERRKITIQ